MGPPAALSGLCGFGPATSEGARTVSAMTVEPCNICESPVRVEQRAGKRRLGATTAPTVEVRVCTSPACPSNNGTRRLGSTV